jgi:hypothetical protein
MRRFYALLTVMPLAGCQTFHSDPTLTDRCNAQGWKQLAVPPANAADLLQLVSSQDFPLVRGAPGVEVWFEEDATHFKACFLPTRDPPIKCGPDGTTVNFWRVANHWDSGDVFGPGVVLCHEKRTH